MTSLADDLLRSRTIPELRELVYSLEKDSGSKKTELQHMVGSKYHDFIQSADKIASMKEKSTLIEQQIQQFWNSNQQLLAKAQTILKYSQPHHKKHQKSQTTLPVENINSSNIWSKLNDCNVYEATKLMLLAQSMTSHSNPSSRHFSVLTFVDATTSKSLHHFVRKLSEDVHRQLASTLFLRETVLDDANMLLLCDAEPSSDGAKHSGMGGTSGLEVIQKAKAIAASSLLHSEATPPTAAALLRAYLAAAEVKVQDLLETHLTVSSNVRTTKTETSEDANVTEHENEAKMGHGITAMVKLLQQILIDVHLLFLCPIDPNFFIGAQDGSNGASSHSPMGFNSPVLGLVGFFQRLLLSETAEHLLQFAHTASNTASPHSTNVSPVNHTTSATSPAHVAFDLSRAFAELGGVCSTGTGSSAIVREQRKVFKHWLEGLFARVTKQCKVVLSSLTSAAEVAQLQQQVWAACVSVSTSEPHTQPTASAASLALTSKRGIHKDAPTSSATQIAVATLDASLSALYTYNQQTWERASEMLLSGTSAISAQSLGVDGASTAHTYLWCGVFRPCFLHQVERLLKRSCDEVLAHTKLQILRTLRQQGVTLDPNTLKITSHGPAAVTSATNKTAGSILGCTDYSADVSHLSSPRIYQMAEKIRMQFEQDITRLLADVVEPVQNTESTPGSTTNLEGLSQSPSTISGDSADPQSIGALARAMRTQCAQLVGHTLVLVRNLVEACQRALKVRAALPARGSSGNGSDDLLYECLYNNDANCILTPDLLEIIKKHSGGGGGSADSFAGKDKSESRRFDRGDHTLLSSLLFLGRLAWLFKIRGNFLDFALQPKAALLSPTTQQMNLASGSVDVGASSHNVLRARSNSMNHNSSFRVGGGSGAGGGGNNEDQFRSAFEIADTNGDGVLSYAEAIEALQALSGESDSSTSSKGDAAKTTTISVANTFNLSPQLTPTLTYTEFALICGSTLLSSDAAQPVLRLQRCLEHIITTAHVTWAVSVVHMLGRSLRAQYLADLGFAYSSQHSAAAGAIKPSKTDEKSQKRPFKVSWVSKWIDLDGHVEDDVSGSNGHAQKEHVLIPGGMCGSLRVFLHKISQHSTSALVSIDTLQTASATVPATQKRPYELVGHEGSSTARANSSNNLTNKTGAKQIRDEFSDLLGEIEEVAESDGEDDEEGEASAFFESSGLLATLAGFGVGTKSGNGEHSAYQEGCKVVLAHFTTRLLAQLGLAYVHSVSMSVLNEARPRNASTTATRTLLVSNEAMEEAALQCVFDLSSAQQLSQPWNMPEWMHTSATKNTAKNRNEVVGFSTAVTAWTAQVDPITAELVLPLVRATTLAHLQGTALLAPHCDSAVLTAAATADHSLRASSITSGNSGAKTSEQLLASVFPTAGHSAPRFALLPLAISTNPVPVAASGRNSVASGAGASTTRYTGAAAPSEANNRSAPSVVASTPAANVARGVMNWFG